MAETCPQNIFYRLDSKINLRLRHNIHQASTELQTEIINYDSRFSSSNKSEKLRWPIEDVLQIESFNLAEIILLLQ